MKTSQSRHSLALRTVINYHIMSCLYMCFHAATDGGALYADGTARLLVRSSTLRHNKATFGGSILLYETAAGVRATSVDRQLACSWQ